MHHQILWLEVTFVIVSASFPAERYKEWQGELWVQPGRQNLFSFRFVGSWFPNSNSKQLFRSLKNGAHSDHKITNWKRKYKPIGLEKSTCNSWPSGDARERWGGGERLYYFAMSPTCSFFLNQRWRHVEDWAPASVPVKNLSSLNHASESALWLATRTLWWKSLLGILPLPRRLATT